MYIQLGIFAMVVGTVSANSYSSIEQYRYFSAYVSDARLQQLMKDYGIQVTGDPDQDLQALYTAMYAEAEKDVAYGMPVAANMVSQPVQAPSQPQQTTNVPWATLMGLVGLSPTGDFSTDYSAFNNQIQVMQASSSSPDQKAVVAQLQAEAQVVFVQPDQGAAQQGQPQAPQQSPPTVSGAQITAMLNQLFMVG